MRPDLQRRAERSRHGILSPEALPAYLRDFVEGDVLRECIDHLAARGVIHVGATVADVGCGFGAASLAAKGHGAVVVGVDIDAEAVSIARSRAIGIPQALFIQGDAEALPLASESIDVAVLLHVLEHVRSPARAIDEAIRVVRPGGYLYVVCPNYLMTFREPHYGVPWIPLLPRVVARVYLTLLRRDPSFFHRSVTYTTWPAVVGLLRRRGLALEFPRTRKLDHPEAIRGVAAARLAHAIRRLRLVSVFRRLAASPLQSTIEVIARRPGAP